MEVLGCYRVNPSSPLYLSLLLSVSHFKCKHCCLLSVTLGLFLSLLSLCTSGFSFILYVYYHDDIVQNCLVGFKLLRRHLSLSCHSCVYLSPHPFYLQPPLLQSKEPILFLYSMPDAICPTQVHRQQLAMVGCL